MWFCYAALVLSINLRFIVCSSDKWLNARVLFNNSRVVLFLVLLQFAIGIFATFSRGFDIFFAAEKVKP